MFQLSFSVSFEYLCYGSTANIIFFLSAEIDFRRQNQTSVDVRFWRLMSIPTLTVLNLLIICHDVLYNKEWQADKHTIRIKWIRISGV